MCDIASSEPLRPIEVPIGSRLLEGVQKKKGSSRGFLKAKTVTKEEKEGEIQDFFLVFKKFKKIL